MSLVKPGDNAVILVVISLLGVLTLLVAATLTGDEAAEPEPAASGQEGPAAQASPS